MTKRRSLMIAGLIALFWGGRLYGQYVSPGFHQAGEIATDSNLAGLWEVLAGFDFDKDGNGEFVALDDPAASIGALDATAGWKVYLYEAAGDNTYELRWSSQIPLVNSAGYFYPALNVGDVDKDGLLEIHVAVPADQVANPPNPPRLFIFEWDGTSFPAQAQDTWNLGLRDNFHYRTSGIALGDVDNDGDVELVLTSRRDDFGGVPGAGRSMVIGHLAGGDIGTGFASFEQEFVDSSAVLKGGAVYDVAIVDFDGDGAKEVWVFTWDMFSLAIYEATGPNSYALVADINEAVAPLDIGSRRGMRFYDANKDGKLECYVSGLSGDGNPPSSIYFIGSTSDVSQLTTADVKLLGGRYPADPDNGSLHGANVGDVDGDGNMDFFYTGIDPSTGLISRVYRLEYKGSGDLADSTNYDWSLLYQDDSPTPFLRNIAIADVDGDKKAEILITNLGVTQATDPALIILESDVASAVRDIPQPTVVFDYTLAQNYPNPFNPVTTIAYRLAKPGSVTLEIYNSLGQRVRTLVNEAQSNGEHVVIWDGRDEAGQAVTSGVYLYKLKAGDFVETRPMILQR